jgi:hypothetical protein
MVNNTGSFDQKKVSSVRDPKTEAYIAGLPEVDTARLPKGALFLAQGRIYQVIETGGGGFHKAREWRKTESTDVALIPGSFPSRYLPVIKRGHVLPVYRSRLDLTHNEQATCFVFPNEALALDAAYFDVALIQSSGAYVRNQGDDPAFAVTDGVHVFRLYYYRQSEGGRPTDLRSLSVRPLPFRPQAHTDGPAHWRVLPTWIDTSPSLDVTQKTITIPKITFSGDETSPHFPSGS